MLSEINFSLFLPLQNSNVVYLEGFCANTVSEDSVPLHRAAFSRNKENLCLFSVGPPAAPVDRYSVLYCTWYNVVALKGNNANLSAHIILRGFTETDTNHIDGRALLYDEGFSFSMCT